MTSQQFGEIFADKKISIEKSNPLFGDKALRAKTLKAKIEIKCEQLSEFCVEYPNLTYFLTIQ